MHLLQHKQQIKFERQAFFFSSCSRGTCLTMFTLCPCSALCPVFALCIFENTPFVHTTHDNLLLLFTRPSSLVESTHPSVARCGPSCCTTTVMTPAPKRGRPGDCKNEPTIKTFNRGGGNNEDMKTDVSVCVCLFKKKCASCLVTSFTTVKWHMSADNMEINSI